MGRSLLGDLCGGAGSRVSTRHRVAAIWAVALLTWAGCAGDAPSPALVVDEVAYSEAELGALTATEREQLATLTAFGLVVARGELPQLAEPFIERARQSLLLQRLTAEVAVREAGFDQERLQSAYDAAPEYELSVRHLVILSERWRSDEHRAAARGRAAAALREARDGAAFAMVAARHSEEPGAARRGGLLEPGRRGTWVSEFWEAASALEVGELSDIVETPYGYHVLRLEERRVIPLAEVRDQILGRLVDLRSAAPNADAWKARQVELLEFQEKTLLDWRAGTVTDEAVLASWPGGTYHGAHLRRYILTLDREATERISALEEVAFLEVVRALSHHALLAQRATELGLALSDREQAELAESGVTRFQALAAALNYRRGATPKEIKEIALRALAPGGQRALIARGEVLEAAPTIDHHYPASKSHHE